MSLEEKLVKDSNLLLHTLHVSSSCMDLHIKGHADWIVLKDRARGTQFHNSKLHSFKHGCGL